MLFYKEATGGFSYLNDSEWLTSPIGNLEKLVLVLRDGRKLIGVLRSWDQFGKPLFPNWHLLSLLIHIPSPGRSLIMTTKMAVADRLSGFVSF